jgi:ubiquinone biosynthesis protein COQ9
METEQKDQLLDAALGHVTFDGWSDGVLDMACDDLKIPRANARAVFPKGALSLAAEFHKRGDAQMVAQLKRETLSALRFRDRVALAVRLRIQAAGAHKEAVRRGTAYFALPPNAAEGARLIWGTADAIWTALGDNSEDYNWYTKRASLSAVYGATVLFWLGDDSEDSTATWDFLERRIDDVMRVEKIKADLNANPVASKLLQGPNWLLSQVRPPARMPDPNLPGAFSGETK